MDDYSFDHSSNTIHKTTKFRSSNRSNNKAMLFSKGLRPIHASSLLIFRQLFYTLFTLGMEKLMNGEEREEQFDKQTKSLSR